MECGLSSPLPQQSSDHPVDLDTPIIKIGKPGKQGVIIASNSLALPENLMSRNILNRRIDDRLSAPATSRLLLWVLITAVLLLAAASRLLRIESMTLNRDEIWSVWQTFGSPDQIIKWTPYDWPPGYYLILGTWRTLTGPLPGALRTLSVLAFLPGCACLFRAVRRLRGVEAALISALVYSGLGFSLLLSLEVRGYALLLGLFPLALWLTLRYFDHTSWHRAVPLSLVMAAMFYVSLTSAGAFGMLGLFTLLVYGRAVWRWWKPGLIAIVLALPEILSKTSLAVTRVTATQTLKPLPLPQALAHLFWLYGGFAVSVWAILFLLSALLIIIRERQIKASTAAILVWVLAVPVALYLLNPLLGFFSARYAWWIMPGIALGIGWGLAYLPRPALLGAGLLIAALGFVTLPNESEYQIWQNLSPLGTNFVWLRENMQGGDVILDNANNTCGAPEEWDYYLRSYFPQGLRFVVSPDGQRRSMGP